MSLNQVKKMFKKFNFLNLLAVISVFIYVVNGFPGINVNVNVLFLSDLTYPTNAEYRIDQKHPLQNFTREDWGAVPSRDIRPIKKPVPYVVIHHTYKPDACNTTEQCFAAMKSMQNYHNSMGWGDIGYNFCVGSMGDAFEGRGWDNVGIHTGRANNFSIGICLIGDWRVSTPPKAMLKATKQLISLGVQNGSISPDYKLVGHNQIMATECPGEALFNEISTWDHFVKEVSDFSNKTG